MVAKALDTCSVLLAVLLAPSLVSAPVVLSPSGGGQTIERRYLQSAETLSDLRRQEQSLELRRMAALSGEKYLYVNALSCVLGVCWGTAELKECGFQAREVNVTPGGLARVASKDTCGRTCIVLSNGVSIGCEDGQFTHKGPRILLSPVDLEVIMDFADIGSKVIWEF